MLRDEFERTLEILERVSRIRGTQADSDVSVRLRSRSSNHSSLARRGRCVWNSHAADAIRNRRIPTAANTRAIATASFIHAPSAASKPRRRSSRSAIPIIFVIGSPTHWRFRKLLEQWPEPSGLNTELAETLALVHDIGHPPFGHAGEQKLDELDARTWLAVQSQSAGTPHRRAIRKSLSRFSRSESYFRGSRRHHQALSRLHRCGTTRILQNICWNFARLSKGSLSIGSTRSPTIRPISTMHWKLSSSI